MIPFLKKKKSSTKSDNEIKVHVPMGSGDGSRRQPCNMTYTEEQTCPTQNADACKAAPPFQCKRILHGEGEPWPAPYPAS